MRDLPARASRMIVSLMNLDNQNNWEYFATEIWPDITTTKIEVFRKEGEMKAVLIEWGTKSDATTDDLLKTLKRIKRRDVLSELATEYPFVRY